jgi:hypothetical protein
MTPEQITRNLYVWLTHASRIDGLPMGSRPCTWDQLGALDPALAAKWRLGVDLFLAAIGAHPDEDDHLNFVGSVILDLEAAPATDEGSEPPPVRPDE